MRRTATFLPTKPVKPAKEQPKKIITPSGTWRVLDYENGGKFREFRSHAEIMGRPLVSIANGIDPTTKKAAVARGVIAIGQRASGTVAIGQFVSGTISIGQFAFGRVFAIGQFTAAPLAIGQFAIGLAVVAQSAVAGWGVFQSGAVLFDGIGQFVFNVGAIFGG